MPSKLCNMRYLNVCGALLLTLTLYSCGGGGGGSDDGGGGTTTPTKITVTATAGDGGNITPASTSVTSGQTTSFTITSDNGYSIIDVTGCNGSLNDNTYTTGAITSACSVNASFNLNEYQVTGTAGDGGTISPDNQSINHGDNATLIITPDDGYSILSVEGCDGSLNDVTYTTSPITDDCAVSALFNQIPSVNGGDNVDIIESDTLQQVAIATDNDGSITSYEWQQLTGPAFEIHQDNTDTLVATAPLVEQDVTTIFQVTVTDDQGGQNTDEVSITIKVREPLLISVLPSFDIPSDVTSVNANELSLVSLAADGDQVSDSDAPTLLIAKDNDGTVMLSLANQNGGFLGEAQGNVSLGIDSTAVTLVAVSAGYPVVAIDTTLVDKIQLHEQYSDLVLQLTALLDADKNYLDRLFDYPDVVAQIKLIANTQEISAQTTQSRTTNYAKPIDISYSRKLNYAQQSTINYSTTTTKDDFYCTPLISWPCSPWHKNQTWQWFGDAKGIKAFYPESYAEIALAMIRSGFSPSGAINYLTADGYAELVSEATQPPFLASSVEETAIHAIANPNFVNYAMEMYEGDEYQGWYYTPSNSTMVQKLLSSGAAYQEIKTGNNKLLNPAIDKVRFQRYRLSYNTNSGVLPDRALAISFMNTLGAVASGINLFADASELNNWIHDQPVEKLLPDMAGCALDIMASIEIYEDTNANGAIEQAISFLGNNVTNLFKTIPQSSYCLGIGKNLGGKTLKKVLARQSVKAGIEFVANLTPVGWAKLAFDGVNDTVPVFTSYFSGNAASSEYYLTWDSDAQGIPYIAEVSEQKLPVASFTYSQKADFALELDASNSVKDASTSLSYEWLLNSNVIGSTENITYDFAASGDYTITLNISDGFENTASHDALVKVNNGSSPQVTSLNCNFLGNSIVKMSVTFDNPNNNVRNIYWYNEPRSNTPVLIAPVENKSANVRFTTDKKYAYGKVVIEDTNNNTDYRICKVHLELIAGRYIDQDELITDITTDLQWQRCSVGQIWDGKICNGVASHITWQKAFDHANSNNVKNNFDWRLPTTSELQSLVYCSTASIPYWNNSDWDICNGDYSSPAIYDEAFPNTPLRYLPLSGRSLFWSSSPHTTSADVVDFTFGAKRNPEEFNRELFVRLVRDSQPLSSYPLKFKKNKGNVNLITSDIEGVYCDDSCYGAEVMIDSGKIVTLTPVAESGFRFSHWQGDCVGSDTCTLSMVSAKQVLAVFESNYTSPSHYNINISKIGSGFGKVTSSPSGIDCGNSCSANFNSASTVTLTASPESGYIFGGWSGECSSNSTTCSITVNQSKNVTAQFIDGEVRDQSLGVCDVWSAAQSGGYGTTVDNWDISAIPSNAIFDIKFDAKSIPDKFTVEYAGSTKLDTGWRGSSSYNGDPLYPGGISGPGAGQTDNIFIRSSQDSFRVTVFGPGSGTSWNYQIRCRQN